MKVKSIVLFFLIAILLQGAAWLLIPGQNHSNDNTLPLITAALLACLFCLLKKLPFSTIILMVITSSIIGLMGKIIVDMHFDPTSHNLFPFEIVITGIIVCIAVLIGAVIGLLGRRLIKPLLKH